MKNRGFTLIEVMMATVVFAGSMAAFAAFYTSMGRMSESSRDLTQAMNDARVVLEAMRNTAQVNGLTGATGVTGVYPAGTFATNNLAAQLGLQSLQNERIWATYAGADPLQVTLRVHWDQRGYNRDPNNPIIVETFMTRRQ